jgi:hypothetical protein
VNQSAQTRVAAAQVASIDIIWVVFMIVVSEIKTLMTCPSLDQGFVNAEVLI